MHMGHQRRKWRGKASLAILFIILLLGGCTLEYGDGLLSLPKLPGEYLMLQQELDAILSTGAVYAAAETGSNRQAVQLIDVDGDGEDEAIAFFRMPTGEFLVCVYKRGDDGYVEIGRAEGFGNTIRAVNYPRVSAGGQLALALSWGLDDSGSYGMTVFGFRGGELQNLMDIQYGSLLVDDIDDDSLDELCFAVRDAVTGGFSLQVYRYEQNEYRLQSDTHMCVEVRSVARMTLGRASTGEPAVYIDSAAMGGGYVTDVVRMGESGAVNDTIDWATGSGSQTWRPISVTCTDIDGDGVLDVPAIGAQPPQGGETSAGEARARLIWMDFCSGQTPAEVTRTCHNVTEKWYLIWPEKWGDDIVIQQSGFSGVSRTIFSLRGEGGEEKGATLLTICVFTGDNRVSYAVSSGVKIMQQTDSAIYGYVLPEEAPGGYALTDEEVQAAYQLIKTDWAAGGSSQ